MKAIILSHENGGSYCIDSNGSFHFVKGHEDKGIGAEIFIETKKPARLRRFYIAFAVLAVLVLAIGVKCALMANSQGLVAMPYCRLRLEAFFGSPECGAPRECLGNCAARGGCCAYLNYCGRLKAN